MNWHLGMQQAQLVTQMHSPRGQRDPDWVPFAGTPPHSYAKCVSKDKSTFIVIKDGIH